MPIHLRPSSAHLIVGSIVFALGVAAPCARATDVGSDAHALSMRSLAQHCQDLRAFRFPALVIEETLTVAAGPAAVPPGAPSAIPAAVLPAHCLLRATLAPRTAADGQHFGIGLELRLPAAWNGRFVFQGGGGLDGVLQPSLGNVAVGANPPALARGFAVVSTDGGHRGKSLIDPRFALDQQARIDYAYNALDKTTLLAKALIARFYGRAPQHSYFVGCSNGGRQALMAAERLPLEFDGVVAGDPALRLTAVNVDEVWNELVLARAAPKDAQGRPILSQALTAPDLQLIARAVLKECDALDGLADGMINDFRACHFDPAQLTCTSVKTPACLSAVQVSALKELMSGPHDSHGHALYAAFPYDAGIADPAFHQMHFGSSLTARLNSADATLGFDSLRFYSMTPPDPAFDPLRFDFDRDAPRVLETAKINDADSVFLSSFASHAKLIVYHGLSDQGLSPLDTLAWYERLGSANAGDLHAWARLFLVPGMTHCAGGPATDQFDMLSAISAWVEQGRAPDRITAQGKAFPNLTRPLCPYPQVARYTGTDPSSETSFACKE